MDAVSRIPTPRNEPVLDYAPGSPERPGAVRPAGRAGRRADRADLHHRRPAADGRRRARRGGPAAPARRTCSASFGNATEQDARDAVAAAAAAAPAWRAMSYDDRAAVFLRAADLLAGPWRAKLNAATMLGQSKTAIQAEIDSACELIDFWRFNVAFGAPGAGRAADLLAGRLEPARPPAAGGLRLRDHAVQLHRDRRQPADRAGPDGQRGDLEAVQHPAAGRRTSPCGCWRRPACRPA